MMLDETQSAASEEDYGSAGHMNGAMDPPLPEEAYGGARDDGPAYKEGPPLNGNPVDLDDLKQEYATNGATDNPLTAPIPAADDLQQGKEYAGRFTAPVNGTEVEDRVAVERTVESIRAKTSCTSPQPNRIAAPNPNACC